MQVCWQSRFVGSAVLIAAGLALAFWLEPGTLGTISGTRLSLCPFRNLTGLPCPGCGMTRAFHHLAHGELQEALLLNPISVILFVSSIVELANSIVGAVRRGRPLFTWNAWFSTPSGQVLTYALVILVFLFGGLRIGSILIFATSAADVFGGSMLWALVH